MYVVDFLHICFCTFCSNPLRSAHVPVGAALTHIQTLQFDWNTTSHFAGRGGGEEGEGASSYICIVHNNSLIKLGFACAN